MKFRFVKHLDEIYMVIGIGYNDNPFESPDYFVCVPLQPNLIRAVIYNDTINIPFSQAIEITDKNTILNLLVLYG